ncbi:hypothetical protein BWD42_13000 [Sphingobacterium sp. CZ-UAM]|uniref:helix-turn-helix domain-containing protein n=1 Tax=Sphingobacterium sp. CZ-UAM TaxID=1933868 RepID=UPI00098640E5|nr:helix-turn-helix transcriptional regulator [Sphingobacterium sp. CZ-UAM]OOG18179.1 hypothetical protein BWD42_13000 [Sphingobacterium sp. CZ-UAM]
METTRGVRTISNGERIEQIRKLMGMSQTELGRRLGVSKQAISKMERAKNIRQEKFARIAHALNLSEDIIESFSQDKLILQIENMFSISTVYTNNLNCQHNAFDKVIELYERLLQLERDKVKILRNKLR